MQSRKRKQKQSKQQKTAPKDNFAEAEKYNKNYHDFDKVLNKIHDAMLESTLKLGDDMKRPATVGDLINFVGIIQLFVWARTKQIETRCVIGEYLLEDTWEMLKSLSKRVNSKADTDKLEMMEQRLTNMRTEDASLNEKFDRIEPILGSFMSFLDDKGLSPKDLYRSNTPTQNEQPT